MKKYKNSIKYAFLNTSPFVIVLVFFNYILLGHIGRLILINFICLYMYIEVYNKWFVSYIVDGNILIKKKLGIINTKIIINEIIITGADRRYYLIDKETNKSSMKISKNEEYSKDLIKELESKKNVRNN